MRLIFVCGVITLVVLLLSMKSDNSKRSLLCHKWVQFAFKKNIASSPQMVNKSMAKETIFKANGTYEDAMYNNQYKETGQYFLNDDTTKMEFMLSSINGKKYPPFPEDSRHYNIIILKLTADTLIYGTEFYLVKDPQNMVYDHSDWYFVRKD